MSEAIESELPCGDYRKSKDSVWLLLDRGTSRFVMGNYEGAISDYNLAIEAIDYYGQQLMAESVEQLLLQDDLKAYCGEDYEQILARVYLALALIHNGDYNNAGAILRQAEELQQRKREEYASSQLTEDYELIDNSLAKYLFAVLLEKNGDLSNASILYEQARNLVEDCQIDRDLENLRSAKSQYGPKNATLLVICHNGNVPIKVSEISDASLISTVALEFFLASQGIEPAISCIEGVATPALKNVQGGAPIPTFITIDGVEKRLAPWFDVGFAAKEQLKQKIPVIAARAAARYLIRRSAVAYLKDKDETLGAVADLGVWIANNQTKADTRSWSTLPDLIELSRFELTPGAHSLALRTGGSSKKALLNLKEGDLCIVHIFNLHPGISIIQIPKQFNCEGSL